MANYLKLLKTQFININLADELGRICNINETCLQFNNKPRRVRVKKGSKDVHGVIFSEQDKTITTISCYNAEGVYLPPQCIMRGKTRR